MTIIPSSQITSSSPSYLINRDSYLSSVPSSTKPSEGPSIYLNAAANSAGKNEVTKRKPTKFPLMIVIIGGCSFVAILALLSTHFVSRRKRNRNLVKIRVTRRKARIDGDLLEVEDGTLDGHENNTDTNLHHGKNHDVAKYCFVDDDSSAAISYGDSKLLETQSMNIDLNSCPEDVSYLNTSSVMELGGVARRKTRIESTVNTDTSLHHRKNYDVAKCSFADDDSSAAISYGDSKLLSDLEMRSMNIDLNSCPDDVSYLNTSSVMGLSISQGKGQNKHLFLKRKATMRIPSFFDEENDDLNNFNMKTLSPNADSIATYPTAGTDANNKNQVSFDRQ